MTIILYYYIDANKHVIIYNCSFYKRRQLNVEHKIYKVLFFQSQRVLYTYDIVFQQFV